MTADRVADLAVGIPAGRSYFPSPADWRDEVLYSVLLDRFAHARLRATHGDPADGNSRHGGNLPGVTSRLDYLAELGVTAIQLSPVLPNEPASYHGYGPLHLTRVEPALGTLDDLQELVAQAHDRGIRIVLDLVLNHVARAFDYPDGDGFRDRAAEPIAWRHEIGPREFTDPARYTRRGLIRDWKDEEQAVRGDFPPGYRRLASEDPTTADLLIHIARWWVRQTDADGIRVDAVRHLEPTFVTRFCTELRAFAAELGKANFLILGEFSTSTDEPLAACVALGLDSVYLYPEYRRQSWALHGAGPAAALARSSVLARRALGEHAHAHGVRFIDNHDVFRFLRDGEPLGRLHAALAFCVLSAGVPMLYYGTEQAFRQATRRLERECSADQAAPHNREDMFADGAFVSASSCGDQFDTSSATFAWTRRLLALRRAVPALRRGRQTERWADEDGPGVYAFGRHLASQELLVAINTGDAENAAQVPVGPALQLAARLIDALDPDYSVQAVDGRVGLRLRPHQVRVLMPADDAVDDQGLGPADAGMLPTAIVRDVAPVVDRGRFPAKAVVGQALPVSATVWWHGADELAVRARFTGPDGTEQLVALQPTPGLDRWSGHVVPSAAGPWTLRIEAVAGAGPEARLTFDEPLPVFADPPLAAASAWYSLFPRSTGGRDAVGRPVHGTLRTAAADLPRIAALGMDVVHLTPIHPIGVTRRKGRDGAPQAGPEDPGCPWAIGSADGGHDAVHPQLGTISDMRAFVAQARRLGLQVALELALQCSPDHPWVREHPSWFGSGTMDAAITERGWTDVVSLDFDAEPHALATEVQRGVEFWIAAGIRTFRVDNPHTKPAAFWHRLIWRVKQKYPDVVFLAEAFTRPALQEGLSALGFSQTLTYFMWRDGAHELAAFASDLQRTADIARPNLFPANHDVLPESLRHAGPRMFAVRAALAATLAASWGIPSGYELGENEPSEHGQGWRHSEKFELRPRDFAHCDPFLVDTIATLNRVRRAHPALQQARGLQIQPVDNSRLLAHRRHDPITGDTVLCVVTLDPHHPQHGNVAAGDLGPRLRDVVTGARITAQGDTVPVTIDPQRGVVAVLVPDAGAEE